MAYQTIPLLLYGLGAALFVVLAYIDHHDKAERSKAGDHRTKGQKAVKRAGAGRHGMTFATGRHTHT